MKQNREKNISKDKIEKLTFLFNQGKLLELIKEAKVLILEYSDSIFLWNILGAANARLKKLNESEKCFYTSIKLNPNFIEGHYNLGKTQKELGKLSEAILSYKKAIEIKPDFAKAYNNYTDSVKIQINDPILLKLDKLINKKNLSEKDSAYLFFAMGKAQLDIGNPEKGLQLINVGNSLRKKELKYKIQKSKDIFDKIKNNFKELNIKNEKTSPDSISKPIFIVGMPRSGTTLVEQILSSHSSIYGAGELDFLDNEINLIDWQNNKIQKKDIIEIRKNYINELEKVKKCAKLGNLIGLEIHAGHGMDYKTAKILSKIKEIKEFNIGHFLIGESIFDGFKNVIKKFKKLMKS